MNATMAITSERKSSGESNSEPPGDRPGLRAYRVKSYATSAPSAHPQARCGPLLQHLAAEAKQGGGPSTGLCRHHPGWFDQRAGFHEAPEILLVQVPPRDRFHGALQFSKCEFGRQKFKDHGAVFQFGAQPPHRGRQDSPVVEAHRSTKRRDRSARECRGAAIPPCL